LNHANVIICGNDDTKRLTSEENFVNQSIFFMKWNLQSFRLSIYLFIYVTYFIYVILFEIYLQM